MTTSQSALEDLLRACTLRLDTSRGPQGTAFFAAPGYAVTAAHVVGGALGTRVHLQGRAAVWKGHVQDVRPVAVNPAVAAPGLYPSPDIALIQVYDGSPHPCVLLGTQKADAGSSVMAYGHSQSAGGATLTAESEHFTVTGELDTDDGGCTLLKLGLGQAVAGMSGAPVLNLATGEVIGMLKASRSMRSSLGAWIVPASVIRAAWPDEVAAGHDLFHDTDSRWRWVARRVAGQGKAAGAAKPGGEPGQPLIGTLNAEGQVTVISHSRFRDLNLGGVEPGGGPHERDGRGGR
jgi:hypothetical protein